MNRVGAGTTAATVLPPGTPLEAFIEREAVRPPTPDIEYRQSADAGLYFLRLLRTGNVGQLAPLHLTHYGIAAPTAAEQASLDAPALARAAIVSNRVPDGARLAADLCAAQPGLPATSVISAANRVAVQTVANAYLVWYACSTTRRQQGPHHRGLTPAWNTSFLSTPAPPTHHARSSPTATRASPWTGPPSTIPPPHSVPSASCGQPLPAPSSRCLSASRACRPDAIGNSKMRRLTSAPSTPVPPTLLASCCASSP